MKTFWTLVENNKYRVGCSGQTIYVFDKNDNELVKFKNINYAYCGKFKPNSNIFVAKSTEGKLAIYDLDQRKLLRIIRITTIGSQDGGFSFSEDGKYFYNIEAPVISTKTQLTVYDSTTFQICNIYFSDDSRIVLNHIECDADGCYILGFIRKQSDGVYDYGFVSKLVNGKLQKIVRLSKEEYDYLNEYKWWELSGFTKKKMEWSYTLKKTSIIKKVSIKDYYI